MNAFNMYPTLTEKLYKSIKCKSSIPEISYFDEIKEYKFKFVKIGGNNENLVGGIEDERCCFNIEKHALMLKRKLEIEEPTVLFGENGIIPENAILGVAVQWCSSKSQIRGSFEIGEIVKNAGTFSTNYDKRFAVNSIRDKLIIKTIIYLKDIGAISTSEKHLCRQTGTILGEIDSCEINLEGDGSIFPIETIEDKTKPLWTVYYDESSEPLTDLFSTEHVSIRFNKAHSNFAELKIDTGAFSSQLFIESLSAALLIIINSVRESMGMEWDELIAGNILPERGTIGEAMYCFVKKLEWDVTNQIVLSDSIKLFFEEAAKGGSST